MINRDQTELALKAIEALHIHGETRFNRARELAEKTPYDIFYWLNKSDKELGLRKNKGFIHESNTR